MKETPGVLDEAILDPLQQAPMRAKSQPAPAGRLLLPQGTWNTEATPDSYSKAGGAKSFLLRANDSQVGLVAHNRKLAHPICRECK